MSCTIFTVSYYASKLSKVFVQIASHLISAIMKKWITMDGNLSRNLYSKTRTIWFLREYFLEVEVVCMGQRLGDSVLIFPLTSVYLLLTGMIELKFTLQSLVYFRGGSYLPDPLAVRPELYPIIQSSQLNIILGVVFLSLSLILMRWNQKNQTLYDLLTLCASFISPNLLLYGQNNAGYTITYIVAPSGSINYSNYEPLTFALTRILDYWWPRNTGNWFIDHTYGFGLWERCFLIVGILSFIFLFFYRTGLVFDKNQLTIHKLLILTFLGLYLMWGFSILNSILVGGYGSIPIFLPLPFFPLAGIYILEHSQTKMKK
ncbi:MAG: hypothetical protein ACFFEV_07595, partial [Candidatus Thorarchaeota archaeon]